MCVIKYYSQALLAVVLSLALPIMKSLKGGRAFAIYSVSSTKALNLYNSLSSLAFQAASLFFLRSSDKYAYFASQLNSAYYILNLWQSHHHHIFLEDHSPVNRWQSVLGFCRLSMRRNCIGGSRHVRFMSHTLRSH